MSSLVDSLVTWDEFLRLPERPETASGSYQRYELHDGEVVLAPPARPIQIKLQKRLERLLEARAGAYGVVTTEFPYRLGLNLQYWFADVAFIRQADWDALPPNDYPVYAPTLIVEVLSPSNTAAKTSRQKIAAMSAGTEEYWVVDPDRRTVQVTNSIRPDNAARLYEEGETIPLPFFGDAHLPVCRIFEV